MFRISNLIIIKAALLVNLTLPNQSKADSFSDWTLQLLSRVTIESDYPSFGGLSDIWVDPNGKKIVTISDKGKFFKGELKRDAFGTVMGMKVLLQGDLLSSTGQLLKGKDIDSESIAASPLGGFFVSFESNNRIMHHKDLAGASTFLPKHSDFRNLHYSKGIEAITIDPTGSLYAIPEDLPLNKNYIPIYKLKDGQWFIISKLQNNSDYKITDATFIDEQNLITLERAFDWVRGFRVRIRRLIFVNEEIVKIQKLLESNPWEMDNLEGISTWKDKKGFSRILLISDDNFSDLQKTELLEYRIDIAKN